MRPLRFFTLLAILGAALGCAPVEGASTGADAPLEDNALSGSSTQLATLGGGCFWCIEAVFERVRGVEKVVSGYSGGKRENPTYEQVTTGATGHAEVVQVHFDPGILSYRQILEIFFAMHDPTTLDRQGADVGTQYRSVVFYHDDSQKETAEALLAEFERDAVFPDPVVTELSPLSVFYEAEKYHQDYYDNNPGQGYCRVVIAPKVNKLRAKYAELLKDEHR